MTFASRKNMQTINNYFLPIQHQKKSFQLFHPPPRSKSKYVYWLQVKVKIVKSFFFKCFFFKFGN